MDPCIHLTRQALLDEAPPGTVDDVRSAESLVAVILERYTRPGDLVLDPFAGYGTTAVVSARMGRRAIAVELLPERARLIRDRVGGAAEVVPGDARSLAALVAGPIDLCLTSPPYMTASGHPENPLTGYQTTDGDYPTYLDELEGVVRQVVGLLRPGGHLAINVADIDSGGALTPLGRDLESRVGRLAEPVAVIPICWDEPPPGLVDDRCLVFRRPAEDERPRGTRHRSDLAR